MYLRKSRKDIEAEKHGEGETLKRHFEMLMSLANRLKIIIREDAIYKEIVSGGYDCFPSCHATVTCRY